MKVNKQTEEEIREEKREMLDYENIRFFGVRKCKHWQNINKIFQKMGETKRKRKSEWERRELESEIRYKLKWLEF